MVQNDPQKTKEIVAQTSQSAPRTPVGLVAVSVAAIAASWAGMAFYMDYRLNELEKTLARETQTAVTQGQSGMEDQIKAFSKTLTSTVNETSSVLAKGILDLTKNEETHHQATLESVNQNHILITQASRDVDSAIHKAMQEAEQRISTIVSQNQQSGLEQVTQAVQEGFNQQQNQTRDLAQSISEQAKTLLEKDDALLSQVAQINQNTIDFSSQLTGLHSGLQGYHQEVKTNSQSVSAQLNEIVNRVNSTRSEVAWANLSLSELAQLAPEAKQNHLALLQSLAELKQSADEVLSHRFSQVQGQLTTLSQFLDQSTQSLMQSAVNQCGSLESAKTTMQVLFNENHEQTATQFKLLSEQVGQITLLVNEISTKMMHPSAEMNADTAARAEALSQLSKQIESVNDNMLTLQSHVDRDVEAAKGILETKIRNGVTQSDKDFLTGVMNLFNQLSQNTHIQFEVIGKNLQAAAQYVYPEQSAKADPQQHSIKETSESAQSSGEIGLNPEDRSVHHARM